MSQTNRSPVPSTLLGTLERLWVYYCDSRERFKMRDVSSDRARRDDPSAKFETRNDTPWEARGPDFQSSNVSPICGNWYYSIKLLENNARIIHKHIIFTCCSILIEG